MKLFVAGLPYDMDDQELQAIFSDYGVVRSAIVIQDRDTKKSKGFGFVEYAQRPDAESAMKALDGATLEGKPMTVKVAEEKPPREGRRERR